MSNINLRIKVMDKEMFWDTEEVYNYYKFQRNIVFGQYRVVSPDKYRESWGHNRQEIYADFIQLSGKNNAVATSPSATQQVEKIELAAIDPIEKLERLAELYENSVLTRDEFEQARQKYVKML